MLWCSFSSEWDAACCGRMCLDSLPHFDRKRRASCSISSLSSAAAGGVGAVFCTADSSAGEQPSSDLSLLADKIKLIIHVLSTSLPRPTIKVSRTTQVTLQSQDYRTFVCFSHLSLRYWASSFSTAKHQLSAKDKRDKNRLKMLHKMSPTEQKHFMIQSQRTHWNTSKQHPKKSHLDLWDFIWIDFTFSRCVFWPRGKICTY